MTMAFTRVVSVLSILAVVLFGSVKGRSLLEYPEPLGNTTSESNHDCGYLDCGNSTESLDTTTDIPELNGTSETNGTGRIPRSEVETIGDGSGNYTVDCPLGEDCDFGEEGNYTSSHFNQSTSSNGTGGDYRLTRCEGCEDFNESLPCYFQDNRCTDDIQNDNYTVNSTDNISRDGKCNDCQGFNGNLPCYFEQNCTDDVEDGKPCYFEHNQCADDVEDGNFTVNSTDISRVGKCNGCQNNSNSSTESYDETTGDSTESYNETTVNSTNDNSRVGKCNACNDSFPSSTGSYNEFTTSYTDSYESYNETTANSTDGISRGGKCNECQGFLEGNSSSNESLLCYFEDGRCTEDLDESNTTDFSAETTTLDVDRDARLFGLGTNDSRFGHCNFTNFQKFLSYHNLSGSYYNESDTEGQEYNFTTDSPIDRDARFFGLGSQNSSWGYCNFTLLRELISSNGILFLSDQGLLEYSDQVALAIGHQPTLGYSEDVDRTIGKTQAFLYSDDVKNAIKNNADSSNDTADDFLVPNSLRKVAIKKKPVPTSSSLTYGINSDDVALIKTGPVLESSKSSTDVFKYSDHVEVAISHRPTLEHSEVVDLAIQKTPALAYSGDVDRAIQKTPVTEPSLDKVISNEKAGREISPADFQNSGYTNLVPVFSDTVEISIHHALDCPHLDTTCPEWLLAKPSRHQCREDSDCDNTEARCCLSNCRFVCLVARPLVKPSRKS